MSSMIRLCGVTFAVATLLMVAACVPYQPQPGQGPYVYDVVPG